MKKKIKLFILTATACLTACSTALSGATRMNLSNLEFTCVHETKPPLSPETQQLYNYARYHDLHNMWNGKNGDEVWQNAAVYYRIAAANGDYKANVRLQYLLRTGRVTAENPKKEVLALNEKLMAQLPATAHYHSYIYLKHGYGLFGVDELGYLRKAADLGSKEAQNEMGELLRDIRDPDTLKFRLDLSEKFLFCAAQQGSGAAAETLGISLKRDQRYNEAVKIFHQGVKNGDAQSASYLEEGFKDEVEEGNIDFLDLDRDFERVYRYKKIRQYLFRHDYLNPTVPDLDQIVPLPPAKLPKWDGKIEFQRWFEGPSPQKPSDELMQKLAAQAGLDWQTGLPLKK